MGSLLLPDRRSEAYPGTSTELLRDLVSSRGASSLVLEGLRHKSDAHLILPHALEQESQFVLRDTVPTFNICPGVQARGGGHMPHM